jgi:hypothetical protein
MAAGGLMGTGLAVLATLLGLAPAEPVVEPPFVDASHFSQKITRGRDTIVVEVVLRPFERATHRLTVEHGGVVAVDGRPPLGTDAGPPEHLITEVAELAVSWNGRRVKLDRKLHADCFNFDLAGVRVVPSGDFRAVMVMGGGGDGAGAYEVYWTIFRDGRATRFTLGEGGVYPP